MYICDILLQIINSISNKMSHQLNNSPAKQKYSFSKEGRFKYHKPITEAYYLPAIDKDRRSALIGYGQRSLGILHTEKIYENIPHAYNIPQTIEVKRGNSFAGGRYQIGSYLNMKELKNIPGPNNYSPPSMMQKKSVSLSSRHIDNTLKGLLAVPGPGAYSVPSSLKVEDRSIIDSKFTNPSSIKIHNSLDLSRRKEPVTFLPGPGQYDVQKYGIGNPQNPLGKNENTKFPKSHRDPLSVRGSEKTPGPAQYKMYSQFD